MYFAVFSLFLHAPFIQTASGYAINFNYAVSAKWSNNLNFMVCLSNIEDKEYQDLFIKAVEEWKARWPHFAYTISYGSGCHINVFIVKTHSMFTENGEIGYTNLQYLEKGAITKADIILPTSVKTIVTKEEKGKMVTTEYFEPLSKTQFYRAALHEFGHALNLGHFDDNLEEPIDIMYAYPASDDQEQGISQRDVNALNWYYLGFFDQETSVRTDKKSYQADDTVNISGKVGTVKSNELVKIEVFGPSKKLYASESLKVSNTGTFTYKMKLTNEMESGSFKVKMYYDSIVAGTSFDIKKSEVSKTSESELLLTRQAEEKLAVLDAKIVDNNGSKITSIEPMQQVFIKSSLSSTLEQTEVTHIVQVKDSEGYTVQISSGTYTLVNGMSTFTQSWLPDSVGKYEVQIFLWNGISDPKPLTPALIDLEAVVG
ncbi:MAG: hypothetical protein ACRD32_06475 [Nitrososphaerales archaeon]